MTTKAYLIFAYALIVLAGGLIGYIKAASFPSLVMGGTSALLLFWCAYSLYHHSIGAYYSSATLTAVLFLFFLYRFSKTHSWMPAGMMAIISITLLFAMIVLPNKKIA